MSAAGKTDFVGRMSLLLIAVVVVSATVVFGIDLLTGHHNAPPAGSSNPPPAAARTQPAPRVVVVENPQPRMVRGVTPAKISADYEFNLETDSLKPIRITYADGQSGIYDPKKPCQQFPVPRDVGPKSFTDPNDPNGHIAFRIYRLRSGEGTCIK